MWMRENRVLRAGRERKTSGDNLGYHSHMGVCPRARSRSPGHNTKLTSQSPIQLFLKGEGPIDASLRDRDEEHTAKAETL